MKLSNLVKFICIILIIGILGITGLYIFAYFTEPIALNAANSYYIYDNKENEVSLNRAHHLL